MDIEEMRNAYERAAAMNFHNPYVKAPMCFCGKYKEPYPIQSKMYHPPQWLIAWNCPDDEIHELLEEHEDD